MSAPRVDLSAYNITVTTTKDGFVGVVADLPGCAAVGSTRHELNTTLEQAIVIALQSQRD